MRWKLYTLCPAVWASMLLACDQPFLHKTGSPDLIPCGDGIVQEGEECDEGHKNSDTEPDACRTSCVPAFCGDGVMDTGEECDDANRIDDDGCNRECGAWFWTRTYSGPVVGGDDFLSDVAIDSHDNIIVTGAVAISASQQQHIWVGKYDSSGNEVWSFVAGTTAHLSQGGSVAVDGEDNVIVAGVVEHGGQWSAWTTKYSPDGTELWNHTHRDVSDLQALATAVDTDSDDNIVVIGLGERGEDPWVVTWLYKYDPIGTVLWTRVVNLGLIAGAGFPDVAIDGDDNIFASWTERSGLNNEVWYGKYGPGGTRQWVASYLGIVMNWNWVNGGSVSTDHSGSVFAVGYESATPSRSGMWLTKTAANGQRLWMQQNTGQGAIATVPVNLAIGESTVVVGGFRSPDRSAGWEAWLCKYDAEGRRVWTRTHNSEGDSQIGGVAIDSSGNIVVAGATDRYGYDHWLRKYAP
ncbi:DUF4215 domain-containing protein [Myxococcota bacterium]